MHPVSCTAPDIAVAVQTDSIAHTCIDFKELRTARERLTINCNIKNANMLL